MHISILVGIARKRAYTDATCQLDKQGNEILLRAQTVLLKHGLFDPLLVDQVYNNDGPARSKVRAGVAWGVLQFATYVFMCFVLGDTRELTSCPALLNFT